MREVSRWVSWDCSLPEAGEQVQMQTGGDGVSLDVNMTVSDSMLYLMGKSSLSQ